MLGIYEQLNMSLYKYKYISCYNITRNNHIVESNEFTCTLLIWMMISKKNMILQDYTGTSYACFFDMLYYARKRTYFT